MSEDPARDLVGRTWHAVEDSRSELVEQAEARVNRWLWARADADWERPELLWAERQGRRRVHQTHASPPARLDAADQYGLDDTGEIAIARELSLRAGRPSRIHSETVALRSDVDQRILAEFHYDHPPQLERPRGIYLVSLTRARLDGQSIAEVETWWSPDWPGSPGGRRLELYTYDRDARPTQIVSEMHRPGQPVSRTRFVPSFDENGELVALQAEIEKATNERSANRPIVVYRRTSPAAVREALRVAERELSERVARWAKRIAPSAPVFALAVAYDAESEQPLPPALALATEDQLDTDARFDLWNPAEFEYFDEEPLELCDQEMSTAFQALNQEWASTLADDQPRKLLVKCAKHLAGRDWSEDLRTAGRLAVYAVDLELEDLKRNLRASVPPGTVQEIENRRERLRG